MGFSCGIVGLPNVGKSTLFNALGSAHVAASNYPFCTIEPNTGTVSVPDPRLDKVAELAPKAKVTPATIQFVDLAGLVKGASHGEGLGNQFLAQIAEVDAIAHVVRCFEDSQVVHVTGSVDPRRDIEIVNTELALKDLATVSSAIARVGKQAKSGDKKAAAALKVYEQLSEALNQGRPVRAGLSGFSDEAQEMIRELRLLTAKPVLYVANISEKEISSAGSPLLKAIEEIAKAEGSPVVAISASLEAQIADLESEEERAEYRAAVGLTEPGLSRLIRAGYELLNLITFFTIVSNEDRAWTVRRGTTAVEAAGKIHSDMARGFIRAEVMSYGDFVACGTAEAAKEQGKLHVVGKEYVVQDGDILHFRFNV